MTSRIESIQKHRALSIFRRAAERVPYYAQILEANRVDYKKIRTFESFTRQVPVIDKEFFFSPSVDVSEMCLDANLSECLSVLPSSGFSGRFSFGLVGRAESHEQVKRFDTLLDFMFNVSKKRTLLVNALSMGITVPASRIMTINTGLRSDIVVTTLQRFYKEFDQFILVAENAFMKKCLEEGISRGLDWKQLSIHLIFGGEGFPESYRTYIERLIGIIPGGSKTALVGSSFGCAEIGLNVLWETPQSISIRRKADSDKKFRKALLGKDMPLCPGLFQYNPLDLYVEEKRGKLLFTNLNPTSRLPLIRYATGDEGIIIPFPGLKKILANWNMEVLLPQFALPLVVVKGRDRFLEFRGVKIFPNMVKHALYSDPDLAWNITGYFRMNKVKRRLSISIQLKRGVDKTDTLHSLIQHVVNTNLGVESDVSLFAYHDFPFAMELDYERKFHYVG